jgi:hypothetical protein
MAAGTAAVVNCLDHTQAPNLGGQRSYPFLLTQGRMEEGEEGRVAYTCSREKRRCVLLLSARLS